MVKKNQSVEQVLIDGEMYFKISNSDEMRPFFMSIVSDSNLWMFISSNGGLSAGRKNADNALFPYYTDDKITESAEITGSKSIFWVEKSNKKFLWEPFSIRYSHLYNTTRNLYKNSYGNKVIFEEINHDLELVFQYEWNSSNTFGFIKKSRLQNTASEAVNINLLDGIQNIMPSGVSSDLQNSSSNLVDAYKRSELDETSGLGIFALSAVIVDKAEPSESLKANIVWSMGLEKPKYLLSSLQLKAFREGNNITQETDIKAEKGAYFVQSKILVSSNTTKEWLIIADVNKNQSAVVFRIESIKTNADIIPKIQRKIESGTKRLIALSAASDALQKSNDDYKDARHFSNTLFNIMRGGIFDDNYNIEKWDFEHYLKNANKQVLENSTDLLKNLKDTFSYFELKEQVEISEDKDFIRLAMEYLPLRFSRRHGDPSRPWNKFTINTHSEKDGSKILDYEGNWRDIFQNWEALALSYPAFIENMIFKFLNASTFDGYNPYRVTKDGFDWESIEADDPWSYIGYWGDHQIIYLLKFLEILENHQPEKLASYFDEDIFVYANVPYKIKKYEEVLQNPKDTINFDYELDEKIRKSRTEVGADGALLYDENGATVHVNLVEKLLATALAKLSNFIPEAGIWMNTQRPEWNDANNALVGNGVSMVTLCYLHRFFKFLKPVFEKSKQESYKLSQELVDCYKQIRKALEEHQRLLSGTISDAKRKEIMDQLGNAASDYRSHIYEQGFWGKKRSVSKEGLQRFVDLSLEFLAHTIDHNQRENGMFHAYNLMTIKDDEVSISHLDQMLEGQVAVLSANYLSPKQALDVLDGLKSSALFREDQYSYLLYPFKNLKGFLERNHIPEKAVTGSETLSKLVEIGNSEIIEKDIKGNFHFNANFNNAKDLLAVLETFSHPKIQTVNKDEQLEITKIYEDVFNHKAFTGRSGTFYGYEGLGSIYWHMVSKLQLAVQETCLHAIEKGTDASISGQLLAHFYEIQEGIGTHKSPELYGAFSTDPYSHTPAGKGAQQPGMTGQVKEDILSRIGELGIFVTDGKIHFNPCLLRESEFISEAKTFRYFNLNSKEKELILIENQLAFTYCQVPIVYQISNNNSIEVFNTNTKIIKFSTLQLDREMSDELFKRSGKIEKIVVHVNTSLLK